MSPNEFFIKFVQLYTKLSVEAEYTAWSTMDRIGQKKKKSTMDSGPNLINQDT